MTGWDRFAAFCLIVFCVFATYFAWVDVVVHR